MGNNVVNIIYYKNASEAVNGLLLKELG